MNRRDTLVALLVLGAMTGSRASVAQEQRKIWRVGFLVPRRRPDSIDADLLGGFPRGMREFGYVEGRNLAIEWRFADGQSERLPALAVEQSTTFELFINGKTAKALGLTIPQSVRLRADAVIE